ncbi:unnamed protein product [Caenorhabditis sp. 36 PRJEB53466]|nr:unnamed protein product [Caenorhabditis sp. 36 PRJEB53466]
MFSFFGWFSYFSWFSTKTEPLSYPNQLSVFQNFSIEKRRQIVKNVPETRKINKIVPVEFNGLNWKFTRTDADTVILVKPDRKEEHVDGGCSNRLIDYVLKRNYSEVGEVSIKNFPITSKCQFPRKIPRLTVEYTDSQFENRDGWLERVLKALGSTQIGFLDLTVTTVNDELIDLLNSLSVDRLKITASPRSTEQSAKQTILEFVTRFKKGNYALGSSFQGYITIDEFDDFWRTLNPESLQTLSRAEKLFIKFGLTPTRKTAFKIYLDAY